MRLVVVLGMHRSGTSCLTHMLHRAGLYLGDNLLCESHSDNIGGHWEARDAMDINDQVLALSGGAWNQVPSAVQGDETTDRRMREFVAALQEHPVAGWKDPRTVLTFPLWKPHLGDYHLVACLRHPTSVARSLETRRHVSLAGGHDLWRVYNQRLLELLADVPAERVSWFDFDAPRDQLLRHVSAICRQLGLRADDDVLATFNDQLRHQTADNLPVPAELQSLYAELRQRAQADMQRLAEHAAADATQSVKPADPLAEEMADFKRQLEQLLHIRRQENQVMQHLDARLSLIEIEIEKFESVFAAIEAHEHKLGELAAAEQRRSDAGWIPRLGRLWHAIAARFTQTAPADRPVAGTLGSPEHREAA